MLVKNSEVITFDQRLYYHKKLGAKQDHFCVLLCSQDCVIATLMVYMKGVQILLGSHCCALCVEQIQRVTGTMKHLHLPAASQETL